jgi:transposase-like protein
MFLVDFIDALFDLGLIWLAMGPSCPKCGGQVMRVRKRSVDGRRWHCRDCCYEWSASRQRVIDGNSGQKDSRLTK